MPVPVSLVEPHVAGLRREAASSFGSSRLSAASYGGAFSVAELCNDALGLLVRLRRVGNEARRRPYPARQAALLRRGFVMTDELMLFLALAGGFTVVLVEWWVRQN